MNNQIFARQNVSKNVNMRGYIAKFRARLENSWIDIPDFKIWFKFDLFRQLLNSHKKVYDCHKNYASSYSTSQSLRLEPLNSISFQQALPAKLGTAFTNYSHHPMSTLFMKNSWAWKLEAIVKRWKK